MTANEPVAWIDKNTGKPRMEGFIKTDYDIPLYTHPVNPYQSITNTKIEPTVVSYTHPVKEQDTDCQYCKQGCIRCDARKQLTDEEMKDLIQEYWGDVHIVDPDGYLHEIAFIKAILRKAQEK